MVRYVCCKRAALEEEAQKFYLDSIRTLHRDVRSGYLSGAYRLAFIVLDSKLH